MAHIARNFVKCTVCGATPSLAAKIRAAKISIIAFYAFDCPGIVIISELTPKLVSHARFLQEAPILAPDLKSDPHCHVVFKAKSESELRTKFTRRQYWKLPGCT